MKTTEKIMDMLCKEMDEIAKKGQLSAGDLDAVYKMAVAKEKMLRCEELEEKLGYSQEDGTSYGRHYVRGHYSRNDGSGTGYGGARQAMADSLEAMSYADGMSERDRENLRRTSADMRR